MRNSSSKAILVLESPWELDDGNSNRTSVLPFVEGIAKLAGDTEVYHANFYDKKSFSQALNCLCKTKFKNTIIYISAHGYKHRIQKISIIEVLSRIGVKSNRFNITGVMLGSCFVGGKIEEILNCIKDSNLRWVAGYSSSSKWLEGTMIDCNIISSLSNFDVEDFSDNCKMVKDFSQALPAFSNKFEIGEDDHEKSISLEESLKFYIQQTGKGYRPMEVTDLVFKERKLLQLP